MNYKDLVWVRKPTAEQADLLNSQPTWDHEAGVWDAHYDERQETFLVIEGEASITTTEGRVYRFQAGDLVTAARDFDCVWEVPNYIKKHYIFNAKEVECE